MKNKIKTEIVDCLLEMASISEPFGLFEPYLWKDKIGDSKWHMQIRSCDAILVDESSEELSEVVILVYNKVRAWDKE